MVADKVKELEQENISLKAQVKGERIGEAKWIMK